MSPDDPWDSAPLDAAREDDPRVGPRPREAPKPNRDPKKLLEAADADPWVRPMEGPGLRPDRLKKRLRLRLWVSEGLPLGSCVRRLRLGVRKEGRSEGRDPSTALWPLTAKCTTHSGEAR